jgi:RNA-directed DNA polymerase
MPSVRFCRYADDAVIHCESEPQAQLVLRKLETRLRECGLELHPGKTRIVCTARISIGGARIPPSSSRFLATRVDREKRGQYGRVYVNVSPGVSREALTAMRQTVRGWHLQLMNNKELSDLSNMCGPVLRGWSNYYGRFYPSAMKPLWRHVNDYLVRWMQRKFKRLARGVVRAARALGRVAERAPRAIVHWENGFVPAAR